MKIRKNIKLFILLLGCILLSNVKTHAQIFSRNIWYEKNIVSFKVSQLYYESDIAINLNKGKHCADFFYIGLGYGKPTKTNAWRKFIPPRETPENLSPQQQEVFSNLGVNDIHAGKISLGWNHWFTHYIGLYFQTGWGFVVDLSDGSEIPDDIYNKVSSMEQKNAFVYNTVPLELGVTLNLWKHYNIQGGVTYMWKEIPLLTVGVGYAF